MSVEKLAWIRDGWRALLVAMRICFTGIGGPAMGYAALLARAAGHDVLGAKVAWPGDITRGLDEDTVNWA